MADINLLQNDSSGSNKSSEIVNNLGYYVSRLLLVVALAIVAYYGYLFFSGKKTTTEITKTQEKITQAQNEALGNKKRAELITRQGQIKELDRLIDGHLYWSYLLPELARVTLRSSKYSSVQAGEKGELGLTVTLGTYDDFDKFMQIFDLPEYNQQFSNVRVVSISKNEDEEVSETEVQLELMFDPKFIKSKS